MVRLVTLYAFALSLSSCVVLARPTHGLSPRHRGLEARATTSKSACKTKTSSAAAASNSIQAKGDEKDETDDKGDDTKTGGDEDTGAGGDDGTVISGAVPAVFPSSGTVEAGWSVAASVPSSIEEKTTQVTLAENTFKITAQSKALKRPIVTHSGKKAMLAHFRKGAYTLRTDGVPAGGLSFYSSGPNAAKFTLPGIRAREVSFGYSIYFSKGFKFNMGGKLPGLYGGVSDAVARTASGGRHNDGAFSCRFMFRDGGKGELYCYLPASLNSMNFCGKAMNRKCPGATANGKTYGATIGTGLWTFQPGRWNTVRQVLRLNDPGKRNGTIKVFIDGSNTPIIDLKNISFGNSAKNAFWGIQVQTFFGGHEPVWASPQDQDIHFADFTTVVKETF